MRKIRVPESLHISMIKPSGTMGGAREGVVWERANIQRWVGMGVVDGEQFLKTQKGL
jgi:hypothetical protein